MYGGIPLDFISASALGAEVLIDSGHTDTGQIRYLFHVRFGETQLTKQLCCSVWYSCSAFFFLVDTL